MVRGVLVQQEGPHTPWTPSRATDQPCQCWTSSSCPQRRGTARPTRHQPLFDFTRDGQRWRDPGTGLGTPWTSQKPIIPAWSLCMSCAVAAQLKKHLVLTHRRVRKEQRGKQAKSFPALSIRQGPGLVEGNFWTNYLLSMK